MAKQSPREQLELLEARGYDIPDRLRLEVLIADRKERGVIQVWECSCKQPEEAWMKLKSVTCPLGHQMKLIWTDLAATPSYGRVPDP